MSEAIVAIVVTYNPERNKILNCINSLAKQVDTILIVDNGSSNCDFIKEINEDNVEVSLLGENKGIAFAQNYGVNLAIEKNDFDYIFFSDQDTVFPEDAVCKLVSSFNKHIEDLGQKVGCCSPFFKDDRTGHLHPSVKLNTFTSSKVTSTDNTVDFLPSHVIASGMLISWEAWQEVGPFREDLFIDWVDTEWCWRATVKGYLTVQTPSVMISHELGYGQKNFAGRSVTIHNSFRNYYKIRNALFLMLYSDYQFKYRYHLFFHSVKNVVFEVLYSTDKMKSLTVVRKAISDAVLKKMNKGN
ncbi:glycosyltransferase family 2 protein [Leclercia sp.]|uniref:glycosyltransferase family 2 protein n=1 Tax=Leclercia sp. TaxID=1898428 RepID=UPI0028976CE9|nr:glycosyltransferase family 2 protein [Leclercia sp.]